MSRTVAHPVRKLREKMQVLRMEEERQTLIGLQRKNRRRKRIPKRGTIAEKNQDKAMLVYTCRTPSSSKIHHVDKGGWLLGAFNMTQRDALKL